MISHGSDAYRYTKVRQIIFAGQFKQITVDVHHNSDVIIDSVTDKNSLSFQQTGDVLSIETTNNQSGAKSSQSIHGGITNIAIGDNATSIVSIGSVETNTTYNNQSPAEVRVIVPKGISVRLQGNIANAQIGDTLGTLILDAGGSGKIEAGSVGSVSARLAGAVSINIAKVVGDLRIDMSGSGKLKVDDGEIRLLDIATTGAGNVDVNAIAEKASIHVVGAGTVRVKQVKTKPEVSVIGAARVDVGGY